MSFGTTIQPQASVISTAALPSFSPLGSLSSGGAYGAQFVGSIYGGRQQFLGSIYGGDQYSYGGNVAPQPFYPSYGPSYGPSYPPMGYFPQPLYPPMGYPGMMMGFPGMGGYNPYFAQQCSCSKTCFDSDSCCADVTDVCGYKDEPDGTKSPTMIPTASPTMPTSSPTAATKQLFLISFDVHTNGFCPSTCNESTALTDTTDCTMFDPVLLPFMPSPNGNFVSTSLACAKENVCISFVIAAGVLSCVFMCAFMCFHVLSCAISKRRR